MENSSSKTFWKFAAGFIGVVMVGLLLFLAINFFVNRNTALEEGTASQQRINQTGQ